MPALRGKTIAFMLAGVALYTLPFLYAWHESRQFRLAAAEHAHAVNVLDYGAAGDGKTDDGAAFARAFADAADFGLPVVIPKKTYVVNQPLSITSGMVIRADGATLTHSDASQVLLSAKKADNWVLQGPLTLQGIGGNEAETGLHVAGCIRYIVDKVTVKNMGGYGIRITPGKATKMANARGNHGQYAFVTFMDNRVGLSMESATEAEYNLFTLLSFHGNGTAAQIASANNIITTSNITDNANGVLLLPGVNHGHGIFSAVNINHNQGFNLRAQEQSLGYTISGSHIYGDGPQQGVIDLSGSRGIHIGGGTIGAAVNGDGGENLLSGNRVETVPPGTEPNLR